MAGKETSGSIMSEASRSFYASFDCEHKTRCAFGEKEVESFQRYHELDNKQVNRIDSITIICGTFNNRDAFVLCP